MQLPVNTTLTTIISLPNQKQDLTSVITTLMRMPSTFQTNTCSPRRKPFQKKKSFCRWSPILTRLKFLTPSNIPKKSSLIDVTIVARCTPSFSDVSSSVYWLFQCLPSHPHPLKIMYLVLWASLFINNLWGIFSTCKRASCATY